MKDKSVLLVSGGVDSTIAHFWLKSNGEEHLNLYFKLGHRYQRKEMRSLINLSKIIDGFDVKFIEDLKLGKYEYGENAYIPHRNLLLALLASNYGNKIYLIGVKGDRVEDKSPEAFKVMSFVINFIQKPDEPKVKIVSPFWNMTKVDIIQWFIKEYGKSYAQKVLETSVSCYDEKTLGSCGLCKSCFRKFIAIYQAGIDCRDWFEKDIKENPFIPEYIRRIKVGDLEIKRATETMKVLKKLGVWK